MTSRHIPGRIELIYIPPRPTARGHPPFQGRFPVVQALLLFSSERVFGTKSTSLARRLCTCVIFLGSMIENPEIVRENPGRQ